jgi:MFS family permease
VSGEGATARRLARHLATAWRHPGTRLGLWAHFTTQFSGTVFALLWGFPFLVSGEGLSSKTASALLTLYVLAGILTAPVIGVLVGRHPLRRSWLVLGITAATALTWAVVLAHSDPAPSWLLVTLVLVLALGGPGSMIGFDYARTFNPPHRLGTATGIVNVGGFVASLSTILLVGLVLDAATPGRTHTYPLDAFRAALSVQFVVWAVGVVGVLRTRRLARRELARQGVVVPPIREAIARHRAARRRAREARRRGSGGQQHRGARDAVRRQVGERPVGGGERVRRRVHGDAEPGGEGEELLAVPAGVRRHRPDLPFVEQVPLVGQRRHVAEVDAGDRERATAVERGERDGH